MSSFLRHTLGLEPRFEEPTTAEFATAEDDRFQVMAPGDPYYDFFTTHATGPVPLFEVDDVIRARQELVDAAVPIIGETRTDWAWQWIQFRAPDGNLYELASRQRRG